MNKFRNLFFKFLFHTRISYLLRRSLKDPIILCFHRVSPEKSNAYPPLNPLIFEKLIQFLSVHFRCIDFSDIDSLKSNKPAVIITFDDAYKDFELYALPVLIKHSVPVTLNVIASSASTGLPPWPQQINCLVDEFARQNKQLKTSCGLLFGQLLRGINEEKVALKVYDELKKKPISDINHEIQIWKKQLDVSDDFFTSMLIWSDMKRILNKTELVKIGNHTYSHLNLNEIKEHAIVANEVESAHNMIFKYLRVQPNRFAFPNGAFNGVSMELVKKKYKYIQLTGLNNTIDYRCFNRKLVYHQSFHENIFDILGFHDFFR